MTMNKRYSYDAIGRRLPSVHALETHGGYQYRHGDQVQHKVTGVHYTITKNVPIGNGSVLHHLKRDDGFGTQAPSSSLRLVKRGFMNVQEGKYVEALDEIHVEGWGDIEPHNAHREVIRHLTSALQAAQEGRSGTAMYHSEKAHMFAKAHHEYNVAQEAGQHPIHKEPVGPQHPTPMFLRRQAESVEVTEEEHPPPYEDRDRFKFKRAMRRQQQKRKDKQREERRDRRNHE